jgi:hypothetical protein
MMVEHQEEDVKGILENAKHQPCREEGYGGVIYAR